MDLLFTSYFVPPCVLAFCYSTWTGTMLLDEESDKSRCALCSFIFPFGKSFIPIWRGYSFILQFVTFYTDNPSINIHRIDMKYEYVNFEMQ